MAHILAIELTRRDFSTSVIADKPGAEPENVATLYVDWDQSWWWARTRRAEFTSIFHTADGPISTYHGFLAGDSDQCLELGRGEQVVLRNYGLNPQAKLSGRAMFGKNPHANSPSGGGTANAFLYYTYFWRKLEGKDMTPRERAEEMFVMATRDYGQQISGDVLAQLRSLGTAENLFSMGAVLLTFAVAAAAVSFSWFVGALSAFCGALDVGTNWEIYKPYWDRFMTQVHTGGDLDYGAQALATLLGGLLGWGATNVVAAGVSHKAAPHVQKLGNKFADAVHRHSPERWKQVAQRGLDELKQQADTKIDPGQSITPERKAQIARDFDHFMKGIREMAKEFGYPDYVAEGYARLAFENGWTIVARTSKKASIPHHLFGSDRVTGKSLYVEYKIDSTYGVIFGDPPRNIEADFYNTHSYAAKQMEAIFYAENPNAPKGSFQITDEVMREFRKQHKFEFIDVLLEGKTLKKVLHHNGKMVIGDVDLMGIYVRKGADLVPLPQWMLHNDAAFLQKFINQNVGGVPTSFHGQQDVGRSPKTGKPFRAPDADEEYAVFGPNLTLRKVKGTASLEAMYRGAHIHWPYASYVDLRSSFAHFVIGAFRVSQPAPAR